jgi:hypothetical protein
VLLPEYPRGSVGILYAVSTRGILPPIVSGPHCQEDKKYWTWSRTEGGDGLAPVNNGVSTPEIEPNSRDKHFRLIPESVEIKVLY